MVSRGAEQVLSPAVAGVRGREAWSIPAAA